MSCHLCFTYIYIYLRHMFLDVHTDLKDVEGTGYRSCPEQGAETNLGTRCLGNRSGDFSL